MICLDCGKRLQLVFYFRGAWGDVEHRAGDGGEVHAVSGYLFYRVGVFCRVITHLLDGVAGGSLNARHYHGGVGGDDKLERGESSLQSFQNNSLEGGWRWRSISSIMTVPRVRSAASEP